MGGLDLQIALYLLATGVFGVVVGWRFRGAQRKRRIDDLADKSLAKLDEASHQRDQFSADVSKLQSMLEAQQTLTHKLETEVAESRRKLESAHEKAKLMANNVLTLREERENTKTQVTTIQNALISVKQQTLALQTEFVKAGKFYKNELRKSFEKRKALEAQVENVSSERDSFSNILQSTRSEHDSINEMLDSAQVQLLQLGVLERNIEKLETENSQLSDDTTQMRQQIETLKRENKELSELKIHNKELTRALESMEGNRRKSEDDAERYRTYADESEKKSDTLRLKLDEVQQNFAEIEVQQQKALEDVREETVTRTSKGRLTRELPKLEVDNLQEIVGIGKVFEETLHDLGIVSFRQIAGFGIADIARVNSHLKERKGRLEQDDWIGQAKELLLKKYG